MKTPDKYKPTIKVTGITEYIEWYKEITSHTFIVTPVGNFYLVDGIRVKAKVFEDNLPKPELYNNTVSKGENLDGRSKWID